MNSANPTTSRKRRKKAFYTATCGREKVPVYRRKVPTWQDGKVVGTHWHYQVANYSKGKRRFDAYPDEQRAVEAADKLARHLSERDVLSASMTREESLEFAAAVQALNPFNVTVGAVVAAVAEHLKELGDLATLAAAVAFYKAHHRQTVKKTVPAVVAELQTIKEKRGASPEYLKDLRYRLGRFAEDCTKNAGDVSTADLQDWLDNLNLSQQSYRNFRTVLFALFTFAERRGYCLDNPVAGTEQVKVKRGDIQIFTPVEIQRLLAAAKPSFLPSLAIGAFAGLRTAEIIRLQWSDVDLAGRHIVIGADRSKTATRRIVPITDNLAAWLAPYAQVRGKVWNWPAARLYEAQAETAAATEVKADLEKGVAAQPAMEWKANALRHSYASYRFALTTDAGRVAGELGNSASMVFKHYRELVKLNDAERWFAVLPDAGGENVVPIPGPQAATA